MQSTPFRIARNTAQALRREAPAPAEFENGRLKILGQVKKILAMSIGRKVRRTPVPELRGAIADLDKMAEKHMSAKAFEFVRTLIGEVKRHECNVNTDRSFKPFMEVLQSELELAGYW